jgi:hypothetical protein
VNVLIELAVDTVGVIAVNMLREITVNFYDSTVICATVIFIPLTVNIDVMIIGAAPALLESGYITVSRISGEFVVVRPTASGRLTDLIAYVRITILGVSVRRYRTAIGAVNVLFFSAIVESLAMYAVNMLLLTAGKTVRAMRGMLGNGTGKAVNALLVMNVLLSAHVGVTAIAVSVLRLINAGAVRLKGYSVSVTGVINVDDRRAVTLDHHVPIGASRVIGKVLLVTDFGHT